MTTTGVSNDSHPRPDGISSTLLAAAVGRVSDRLDTLELPDSPADGMDRGRECLDALRAKLEHVIGGGDPTPVREWIASSRIAHGLLQAVGEELFREAAAGGDVTAMPSLVVLRAWAALQVAPSESRGFRDRVEETFRGHLSGPDAFGVLVEVAHDFRSPLASILFLSEALRDGHSGPVTDTQRSQLGLIYSAAFGLAAIASDVMDLARQQKDLIDADMEPFAPADVFAHVERMVRPLVEEKGLELRVIVPERLQSRGHPHALGRVLLNLTTNAIKFTDEGSVEIGVYPVPRGMLEYYVKDTGRGMSFEQQKNLFQPFRRRTAGGRTGRQFSASGVGLSIARRLLLAMGSDLALDSSDERGTRFSFVLSAPTR